MYNVGEIKKKKPVYLPDFIIPAVLRALSVTHRVGGRRVSDSTGLPVQELVLTSSAHLRGVDTLKKYAKITLGGGESLNKTTKQKIISLINDLTVKNPKLIWLNSNFCLCKRAFFYNLLAIKPHNYCHDRSPRLQSYPSFSPFLLRCILLCSLPFCLQPLLIQLVLLLKTNTPTPFFRARMKMNGCRIKLTSAEFCINGEKPSTCRRRSCSSCHFC